MDTIPIELIDMICYYLTLKERCRFMITRKDYYKVVDSNQFYEFCKNKKTKRVSDLFINRFNNVKFTRLLYYLYPQISVTVDNFYYACENEHLETAKWLISLNQYILSVNEYAFIYACKGGHLEIAKWLLSLNRNINIHAKNEIAFEYACENGHLETAKWLISLNQNINIHADNESTFRYACENGHLETAKWLLSLNQNIDIHAENEYGNIF